jgi:hypothetical protein
VNERIERDGLVIDVLASDERRVSQVRLRRADPPPADAEPAQEEPQNGETAQA